MKSRAEQLDEMSKAILIATDRIRYYKQQDKMLQSEIKRLTRNERTHRLCTRGGMIEAFIQEPEKLSDDQVTVTVHLRGYIRNGIRIPIPSNEAKTILITKRVQKTTDRG